MKIAEEHRGILIFSLIAVTLSIAAIAAYLATGPMGIEERFTTATGLPAGEEVHEGGATAVSFIEGNTFLYILVLAALAAACVILYRHYRI